MLLPVIGEGPTALVTDPKTVTSIKLSSLFRFVRGEWFLDTSLGFPWPQIWGVKNPNLVAIRQAIRKQILAAPLVASVLDLALTFDRARRDLQYSGSARLVNGDVLPVSSSGGTLGATSINPSSGSIVGGTTVLILGTGLQSATSVTFMGVGATIISSSSLGMVVDTGQATSVGTGDVVVTTPTGTLTLSNAWTYTFAPTDLGGLVAWYTSQLGVHQVAGAVSQWDDQSGNGHNATQSMTANQPTYVASGGAHGLPYLTATDAVRSLTTALLVSQPCEILAVVRPSSVGNEYLIDCGTNQIELQHFSGAIKAYAGGGLASGAVTAGDDIVIDAEFTGASSSIAIDGGAPVTGNVGAANGSGTVTLGNYGVGGFGFEGFIYELIIYNRILTTTERTPVTAYLTSRYL